MELLILLPKVDPEILIFGLRMWTVSSVSGPPGPTSAQGAAEAAGVHSSSLLCNGEPKVDKQNMKWGLGCCVVYRDGFSAWILLEGSHTANSPTRDSHAAFLVSGPCAREDFGNAPALKSSALGWYGLPWMGSRVEASETKIPACHPCHRTHIIFFWGIFPASLLSRVHGLHEVSSVASCLVCHI